MRRALLRHAGDMNTMIAAYAWFIYIDASDARRDAADIAATCEYDLRYFELGFHDLYALIGFALIFNFVLY